MMPLDWLAGLLPTLGAAAVSARGKGLRHPLRQRIHEAVQHHPGILTQELADLLGCNRSTLRYHLGCMKAIGTLRVVSYGQRAHVFLSTRGVRKQEEALAILQRGRTWDLVREIAQNPGLPQRELTSELQMSRKILRKYVDRLVAHDLIEEVAEPPFLIYYPTQSLRKLVEQHEADGPRQSPAVAAGPDAPRPP